MTFAQRLVFLAGLALLPACGSGTSTASGFGGSDGGGDVTGGGTTKKDSGGQHTLVTPDTGAGDGSCGKGITCASAGVECGILNDGCGKILECGSCPSGQTCGGGGKASMCGSSCVPTTCEKLGFNCGPAGDGCGGMLQCGSCGDAGTCGGGGMTSVCGSGGGGCMPTTCTALGYTCGPAGDGCGGMLDCGMCTAPDVCGSVTASQCGAPKCTSKSCADLGITCGPASDGCGNELQCGSCTAPQACGGGTTPGVCGCTGSCSELPTCAAGQTTTLTGFVYDPADLHPLNDILVYIPNNPADPALTAPFPKGVTCDQCGVTAAGNPLVTTYTAPNGSFTLSGIPVSTSIPLVIQSGHWRRQFTVNVATSCGANTVATTNTTPVKWLSTTQPALAASGHLTFPTTSTLGDIPYIAILTGGWDPIECVLRKMGVADTEFVNPGGAGHIQFYLAAQPSAPTQAESWPEQPNPNACPADPYGSGAQISGATPNQAALFAATGGPAGAPAINNYDLTILACEGYEEQEQTYWSNLGTYTGLGGRVFATDFGYDWLASTKECPSGTGCPAGTSCEDDELCIGTGNTTQNPAFPGVATWNTFSSQNAVDGTAETATVDLVSNPNGAAFQSWLQDITPAVVAAGADTTKNKLNPVFQATNAIIAPTQQQLYWGNEIPIEFTFNTPVGAAAASQCGRVNFMDWHADLLNFANPSSYPGCYYELGPGTAPFYSHGMTFPKECDSNPMTAQEAVVEFMLFDVTACVTPYQATCTSESCAQQGITCGPAGDGCGNLLQCGTCPAGETCGGGGTSGVCGNSCTPTTCSALHIQCGPAGDGCGGALACGTCPTGQTCGANGMPGVCGSGTCTGKTCSQQNISCGPAGDGCGNPLQCGNCPTGQTCGGGGTPGQCGTPPCIAKTCTELGFDCGPAGDGCGNQLNCGTCTGTNTCGGGGTAGQCGNSGPK